MSPFQTQLLNALLSVRTQLSQQRDALAGCTGQPVQDNADAIVEVENQIHVLDPTAPSLADLDALRARVAAADAQAAVDAAAAAEGQ